MKYFVFILVVISCKRKEIMNNCFDNTSNISQQFTRQIPVDYRDSALSFSRLIEFRNKLPNIDTLENGVDGYAIRLWFCYVDTGAQQMIYFSRYDKKWSAKFYSFTVDTSFYSDKKIIILSKEIEPQNGWNLFLDSLCSLDIVNLRSQKDVPDMFESANLSQIEIEVADKYHYRYFSIQSPYLFGNKFKESKNLIVFLELIKKEFGFRPIGRL